MNFLNLKTLARGYVPGAKVTTVTNANMEILLNEGAIDVAAHLRMLKKNVKFNITANKQEYAVTSDIASDYLSIDDMGVWWNDGSQWKQLKPYTLKKLDEERPTWRDFDSGDPELYYLHGDIIGLHPKPDTTLSSGGWLYYNRKPQTMSDDSHYPFHVDGAQTTEIGQFAILSECILAYWEWKSAKFLSKKETQAQKALKEAYYTELMDKAKMIGLRPDVSKYSKTAMRARSHK